MSDCQSKNNPNPGEIASAWGRRADELARWAWARLVVRTDAWGNYRPLDEVGREYVGPDDKRGKLGPQTTRKGRLTVGLLRRHFAARGRADIIGLHSTAPDSRCRSGALDIDHHGPTSTAADINLRAALHWYGRLAGLGFRPLLTASNGKGGYHLRLLLSELVPSELVYRMLHWLIRDHAQLGYDRPPETFPKQPRLEPGGYGNWLRLPGRHHTLDYWSEVYAGGGEWLSGAAAVDHILSLTGDSPSLIPAAATAPPPRPAAPKRRANGPGVAPRGGDRDACYAAYMNRLPNGGEGTGRDNTAFAFAAWLVRDMEVPDDIALDWLERWDAGNSARKGRERLAEILANAHQYGHNPVGCGLRSEPPCRRVRNRRPRRPEYTSVTGTVEVS